MRMPTLGIAAAVALFPVWNGSPAARQHAEYSAHMNASAETPPNMSHASGTVTLTVSGNELHYMVTVGGLSGPATAAHIHVGAPGVAGPPVLTFTVKSVAEGTVADDSVDLTKEVSKGVTRRFAARADGQRERLRERAHGEIPGGRDSRPGGEAVARGGG